MPITITISGESANEVKELVSELALVSCNIPSEKIPVATNVATINSGFHKILSNMKRFEKVTPSIFDAINAGELVAAYDCETGMVITQEILEGTLRVQIIKCGYIIPKKNGYSDIKSVIQEALPNRHGGKLR